MLKKCTTGEAPPQGDGTICSMHKSWVWFLLLFTRALWAGSLHVLPDGRLLGKASYLHGNKRTSTVAVVDAAGALDPGFGTGGMLRLPITPPLMAILESDLLVPSPDTFVLGVVALEVGGNVFKGHHFLAGYDLKGALTPSFGDPAEPGYFRLPSSSSPRSGSLHLQGDKLIVGHTADLPNNQSERRLARFTPSGVPDPSFGPGGSVTLGNSEVLTVDPAGGLVVFSSIVVAGAYRLELRRLLPDGSPDTSYGPVLLEQIQGQAQAVSQPDGKLLIAGPSPTSPTNIRVTRLHTDGTLDAAFGTDGTAGLGSPSFEYPTALALAEDGSILVAASRTSNGPPYRSDCLVAKFEPGGNPDSAFGAGGYTLVPLDANGTLSGHCLDIRPGPSGSVFVQALTSGSPQMQAFAKLEPGGGLDAGFGNGGVTLVP
jgi:uncharacterized delta-60 repeat protein